MNRLARWNPRLHLSAAIGWAVFALVALAALAAANLAASDAERSARADAQGLLQELAAQSQQMLSARLQTHGLLLLATAAQIAVSSDRGSVAVRHHLEALQQQFPEFAWIGVADERGRVLAGTGGVLQGDDVADLAWFRAGRAGLRFGAAPSAAPPAVAALSEAGAAARVVDVSVPLIGAGGAAVGVVAGYLSWPWLQRLQDDMRQVLGPRRSLELLLTAPDGTVLAGPPAWRDRVVGPQSDLTEAGRYLVARATRPVGPAGADWTEVVRQPVEQALAPARLVRHAVFGVVLLSGLLAAGAAVFVTRAMMRRLAALADEAEAVRRGARSTLSAPGGADDVGRIGAALAQLVDQLQREKDALTALNRELDARVAERTARVERLAVESRRAAVTRERLRLARDLHDTLSHSLMALLTQVRLVRKLRGRLDADALDAELARAEEAAAGGLVEARAAIAQMRSTGVADSGLGPALDDLLKRLAERTGVAVSLDADPEAARLADARAETAFRIAEEALRNVERHARARRVGLTLRWQAGDDGVAGRPARVRLTIADDGVGFDAGAAHPGHFGLQGMREQAALIAARLDVHSGPGQGTRIELAYDA